MVKFVNWYIGKLHIAAAGDPVVARAFHRVANLLDPPPQPDAAVNRIPDSERQHAQARRRGTKLQSMAKKRSSAPSSSSFVRIRGTASRSGPNRPAVLNAYIEITPFDLMKYEVDKVSGYLHVDRPQRISAQHPALYGFMPRTYCAERVRKLAPGVEARRRRSARHLRAERAAITRNEIIVRCRVIGGLQMIDRGEADDKIIAVLENDYVWGDGARHQRRAAGADRAPAALLSRPTRLVPGQRAIAAHPQGLRARPRAESGAGGDRRLRCGISLGGDRRGAVALASIASCGRRADPPSRLRRHGGTVAAAGYRRRSGSLRPFSLPRSAGAIRG